MYSVVKQIHFCYGHRLLKHKGKCSHLHGHNAVAEIHCEAQRLDSNQMVVDFDRIKEALNAWIQNTLDHRMILSEKDPILGILKKMKEPLEGSRCFPTT